MQLLIAVLLFSLGLLLTVKGGDIFTVAASEISEIFGIPKFIIGATIVSLATTLPEFLVSVISSVIGKNDMAVGNAIGSVSANTGLILALCALLIPCRFERKHYAFKTAILISCSAAIWIFSVGGSLRVWGAVVLLMLFLAFVFENVSAAKTPQKDSSQPKRPVLPSVLRFSFGALGIALGARLLVDNASAIGLQLGISEAVISATVLAVGTSLPELATTLSAVKHRESALSIGNILGANIIDLAIILPTCSVLSGGPLPVSRQATAADMPFCFIIICVALLPALVRGKFTRFHGAVTLCCYVAYIIFTAITAQ
jgi:cation:H+ antiporter